jgi:UDP-glucose 4-epimerase
MKKALVTGGAGFIGSHIVDALVRRKYRVLVIDDLSSGKRKQLNPKATLVRTDIRSDRAVAEVKKFKPEVVFHCAAQIDVRLSVEDAELDAHINLIGGVRMLEAARKAGVKKFIFSSSGGALYGNAKTVPTPETYLTNPLSPYGVSKLSFEHYLHCYEHLYGMKVVTLRYANVYGPRQAVHGEAAVVAHFTNQLLRGKQPVINGDGKQTRDYVSIDDVVRANMIALQGKVRGTYNIGTGKQTSVNQLFRILKKATGADAREIHGKAKLGEERRSALSFRKAARELGWKPRVSLEGGLKKTVQWFKEQL